MQFRSPTIGGDGAAFFILELERRTGMYFLSHFGVCDGRDFSDRRVSNYEGILFSSVFFSFFFFFFFFFSFQLLASLFKCIVIRSDPSDTETLAVGDASATMTGVAGCKWQILICLLDVSK